jgi:hypothetical protein
MKNILILVFAFLGMQASAQSLVSRYERLLTEPHSYVCYRTAQPITLDGRLNESAWQQVPWTAPFEDISGKGFATPKYQTHAKVLWDDNNLYIAAEIEEPNVRAKITKHDDIIYRDNDFEMFLDPDDDAQCYFEIEMNSLNTLFELMLNKPYRDEGNFFDQWDCPGIRTAVHVDGTLNDSTDKDRSWTVEVAIPYNAVKTSFDNPLKAGHCWRINFSRVEWVKKGGPEENWVWSATGQINMHMPERWGYLYLSDKVAGTGTDTMHYPHDMNLYKLMWAMYYAQSDALAQQHAYMKRLEDFHLTAEDLALLPPGARIELQAADSIFKIIVEFGDFTYTLNNESNFQILDKKHPKK